MVVGTGVPDCPFGRKCYFMTARVAEDVDPYNSLRFLAVGERLAPPDFLRECYFAPKTPHPSAFG